MENKNCENILNVFIFCPMSGSYIRGACNEQENYKHKILMACICFFSYVEVTRLSASHYFICI